jgi:hypothetical protein
MSERTARTIPSLHDLYVQDETAWLDKTAGLVAQRRWEEIDREHLSEYLTDMANRDRREVLSRMTIFLAHWLKWDHQPQKQSRSWQRTLFDQQLELSQMLESSTLKRHAQEVFEKAYAKALKKASLETGLPIESLPPQAPWSLDELLVRDVPPLEKSED